MKRKRTVSVQRSWDSALEDYLVYKQSQGRRDATLLDLDQKIRQFFRTYPMAWPAGIKQAAQDWLGQKGIMPATYNLRLSALRGFFKWAIDEGLMDENPVRDYKALRKEPRIVDVPDSVLERLIDLPDKGTFVGLRDSALIMLTLDTGIRPQEARRLLVTLVDLVAGTVNITQEVSKTHRSRTLYMSPETVRAVKSWVRVRPAEWDDGVRLFATEYGMPLTKDSWGDRMELYSINLGTKVRAYDLRHAFAIRYLRNGGNCFMLQRLMGHTRPEQTMQYLAFVTNDLENDHKKASPIRKLTSGRHRVPRAVSQTG